MISLEKFKDYMRYVEREEDFYNKMSDLYKEYRDIVGDAEAPFPCAGDNIVTLLEESFELEKDMFGLTDISWWVYETNFGKKKDILYSYEVMNAPDDCEYKHPKLENAEDLYKFIIWEKEHPEYFLSSENIEKKEDKIER